MLACRYPEEEKLNESVYPLVSDRDSRREDKRRLIQTPDDLKTQHGFSRSRSGNQMKALIVEVTIKMVEEPRLVNAPILPERHHIWQSRPRIDRRERHEMRIIWSEVL